MKNFKAFTLAETLITLTILGVIAAITVPAIITNRTERETISKVFKMYSTLQNTFDIAVVENDGNIINLWSEANNATAAIPKFYEYLNIDKICETGTGDCFVNNKVSLDGTSRPAGWYKPGPSAIFHDGSSILSTEWYKLCNGYGGDSRCAFLFYDVNGKNRGKNQVGIDIFLFFITKDGISLGDENRKCFLSKKDEYNGNGCADWIIKNNNMQYLHDKTKGYNKF